MKWYTKTSASDGGGVNYFLMFYLHNPAAFQPFLLNFMLSLTEYNFLNLRDINYDKIVDSGEWAKAAND